MDLTTTIILVLIFTSLEAFFSGSEIALISANRIKIQHKAAKGNTKALAVMEFLKNPERAFAITSLGTNLAVVTSTAIFAAYMIVRFPERGDLYATLILFPLILFAGEIVPKMICQNRADTIILHLIRPLNFFYKLFTPVITFFTKISTLLLKGFTDPNQIKEKTFSRQMVRQIISLDSKTADLGTTEREMIHKIFNFGETTVEKCMTPLVQLYSIKDTATHRDAHFIANSSGFSRLPVYHERLVNLIGVMNTFDLLGVPNDDTPITGLIRPAYYVPPNKKTDDLLKELQQRGLHLAIVVDEYGGCIGIVTLEDLLEEIVGEIEDEFDKKENRLEKYAEGGYLIEGDTGVEVINQALGLALPRGDYETLAGLIVDRMGNIPSAGDQVIVNTYRLTVKEASKRKINSVILLELSPSTQENSAAADAGLQGPQPKNPVSLPGSDKPVESP